MSEKKTATKTEPKAKTELKKGDEVTWSSSQGEIEGKVVKKITTTAKIKGHTAKATPEKPEYEVESAKTKAHAIHKPAELKKTKAKK